MKQQNIQTKHNLLIGIIAGLWLFLFLFLTKPFKQYRLNNLELFYIASTIGLNLICCYFVSVYIQNRLFKKHHRWDNKFEGIFWTIFILLSIIGTFLIYKSDIAKGSYNLPTFLIRDYLPSAFILVPFIALLRRYFFKRSNFKEVKDDTIYIYGENKLDYLKLDKKDLISISSAQNYIEISFLMNNELQKKLIRSSLKKAHTNLPFLIQVHRSHLINPVHFISFKDKKKLVLTGKEIPFSNTYKEQITLSNGISQQ